jgi:hypothetical protein
MADVGVLVTLAVCVGAIAIAVGRVRASTRRERAGTGDLVGRIAAEVRADPAKAPQVLALAEREAQVGRAEAGRGARLLGIGLAVTVGTFAIAPGGYFVVAFGPVIGGLARLGRSRTHAGNATKMRALVASLPAAAPGGRYAATPSAGRSFPHPTPPPPAPAPSFAPPPAPSFAPPSFAPPPASAPASAPTSTPGPLTWQD